MLPPPRPRASYKGCQLATLSLEERAPQGVAEGGGEACARTAAGTSKSRSLAHALGGGTREVVCAAIVQSMLVEDSNKARLHLQVGSSQGGAALLNSCGLPRYDPCAGKLVRFPTLHLQIRYLATRHPPPWTRAKGGPDYAKRGLARLLTRALLHRAALAGHRVGIRAVLVQLRVEVLDVSSACRFTRACSAVSSRQPLGCALSGWLRLSVHPDCPAVHNCGLNGGHKDLLGQWLGSSPVQRHQVSALRKGASRRVSGELRWMGRPPFLQAYDQAMARRIVAADHRRADLWWYNSVSVAAGAVEVRHGGARGAVGPAEGG